jgi:hypothetical protein
MVKRFRSVNAVSEGTESEGTESEETENEGTNSETAVAESDAAAMTRRPKHGGRKITRMKSENAVAGFSSSNCLML